MRLMATIIACQWCGKMNVCDSTNMYGDCVCREERMIGEYLDWCNYSEVVTKSYNSSPYDGPLNLGRYLMDYLYGHHYNLYRLARGSKLYDVYDSDDNMDRFTKLVHRAWEDTWP